MREERTYIVYILASGHYGTLYIGVTNDIYRRMHEHRAGKGGIFTRKYKVARLVHMEGFGFIEDAIKREKQLKHWRRDWKINLIERENPHWADLFVGLRRFEPKPPTPEQVGTWVLGTGAARPPKDDT